MNDLERFLNEQVGFLGCRTIFKKIHLVTEKITNPKSGLSLVSLAALYGDEKNNTLSFEQIVEEDTGAESVHSVIRALDVLARAYMAHVLNEHRDITIYLRRIGKCSDPPEYTIFYAPYDVAENMDAGLKWQPGFPYNEVRNGIREPVEQLVDMPDLGADVDDNPVVKELDAVKEEMHRLGVYLELNGCDSSFTLIEQEIDKGYLCEDGEPAFRIHRAKIYNDLKNNVLHVGQFRKEGEEFEKVPAILDAMPEAVRRYLADLFNKNNNRTVYLNQYAEGGAINVLVIHEPYAKAKKINKTMVVDPTGEPMYTQIKNGMTVPIKALAGFGPSTGLNS